MIDRRGHVKLPSAINRQSVPVIVVSRDRPHSIASLVDWLEQSGCENVHIVDMASSHPELMALLESSMHQVHRLDNVGPHALWSSGFVAEISGGGPVVVTDADVMPAPDCPLDAIEFFAEVLGRYPSMVKVGFGLRLDDIPDEYEHRDAVLNWERQFWRRRIRGNLYSARIDTTFALYRSGDLDFSLGPAIRTGAPYLARHLPWYEVTGDLSAEEQYYRANATTLSTWSTTSHRAASPPGFSAVDWLKWRVHVALRLRPTR